MDDLGIAEVRERKVGDIDGDVGGRFDDVKALNQLLNAFVASPVFLPDFQNAVCVD